MTRRKRLSKPVGVSTNFVGRILKALHDNDLRKIITEDARVCFVYPITGWKDSATCMFFTDGHTKMFLELGDFLGVYVKEISLVFVRRVR